MDDQQGVATNELTVQEIFGLPQGCRALLQRTMGDMIFKIIASRRPDVAIAIEALSGQTATLVTAAVNLVELRLDDSINLGSVYDNVTIQLARAADGFFSIQFSGSGSPPLQHEISALSVTRQGPGFVLADTESRLRFTPTPSGPKVEVYTVPFLKNESAMVRALAPDCIDLFSLIAQ